MMNRDQKEKSRESAQESDRSRRASASGLSLAMRMSTDLVSTVFVGGGLGYLLDYWFNTNPWLTIVFFLFGTAAGFRNIYRYAMADSARHAADVESKSEEPIPASEASPQQETENRVKP